ncbi:hypothetical protein SAMN05216275_14110 [Streptosporangium canum]|uniref:Uncharacterized protein n=1 Tax=Streptosporangium canum TaxID=324952 RepID=A0A1I4DEQ3_9ACTN|nr:hypothetical protein [Streptosporangium canum]SFK91543.1 hypothetical protein SAMN05216275_14110 [Streptosporangium canum]
MSILLPGFALGQEVNITFCGAQITDIGGNFIDVELADGEELTVLPGADGVEVTPAGTPQPAERVLAALAEVLTELGDIQHSRVIMAAAVLAHQQPDLTAREAAELTVNDTRDERARAAWNEARQMLALAEQAVDRG